MYFRYIIYIMADLLIVGPGRLGLLVAGLWRQQQQAGQTATSSVHLKFRSDNAERTKDMEQQGYTVLPAAADTLVRETFVGTRGR